jgi:predicted DNA-binding transcriptional regulator YafY
MARTLGPRGSRRSIVITALVEHLRRNPEGFSKAQLVARIGNTSPQTVQRALEMLTTDYGAPIVYERSFDRWRLMDPHFALPLDDPHPNDLRAVLIAEAMLVPLADDDLRHRLRLLAEQLDHKLRRKTNARAPATSAVSARATMATRMDARHLAVLHHAVRRHAVRMDYVKPRENESRRYTIEPWGICAVDSAFYFKGWVRERERPRTFRLAQVKRLVPLPDSRPTMGCPRPDVVWGDDRPAFGIDEDRPDTAVLRIRGSVARWVHPIQWHAAQVDRWIDEPELIERTIPYRSCREMARRVLTILDGVESIEPPELRDQVEAMLTAYQQRVPPSLRAAPLARTPGQPSHTRKKARTKRQLS